MKVQQIEQRSVNADSGEKEYQKEDLSELERLVRQLVKLQSEKERLTKQLADEQRDFALVVRALPLPLPVTQWLNENKVMNGWWCRCWWWWWWYH